jgi:hypothetical protein
MTAVDSIKIVPLSVSLSSGAQRAGGQGEMNIFTASIKLGIPVEQLRNFDTDNTNTLNAKEQKLLEVYLQQAQNGQQAQGAQQEQQSDGGLLGLGNLPIVGNVLKKIPLVGKLFGG